MFTPDAGIDWEEFEERSFSDSIIYLLRLNEGGAEVLASWLATNRPDIVHTLNALNLEGYDLPRQPQINRGDLRKILVDRMTPGDIKELGFSLGVPYEDLENHYKSDAIITIISYSQKRNRIQDLLDYIEKTRPDINLESIYE